MLHVSNGQRVGHSGQNAYGDAVVTDKKVCKRGYDNIVVKKKINDNKTGKIKRKYKYYNSTTG